MKTKLNCEVTEEAFLQTKLTKITSDEVLDFYLAMTLAPTVESFLGRCAHDRTLGRASNFVQVQEEPSKCRHGRKPEKPKLFHCAACNKDFIESYQTFDLTMDRVLPICPDCGSSLFVDEVEGQEDTSL